MADIDEVLRLVAGDAEFRTRLVHDPQAALDGYEVSAEDLDRLAREIDTHLASLGPAGFLALFD